MKADRVPRAVVSITLASKKKAKHGGGPMLGIERMRLRPHSRGVSCGNHLPQDSATISNLFCSIANNFITNLNGNHRNKDLILCSIGAVILCVPPSASSPDPNNAVAASERESARAWPAMMRSRPGWLERAIQSGFLLWEVFAIRYQFNAINFCLKWRNY
jgi:hypothetical protein